MKEVFAGAHHPAPITPDDIPGTLSLTLWSLTLMALVQRHSRDAGSPAAHFNLPANRVVELDARVIL